MPSRRGNLRGMNPKPWYEEFALQYGSQLWVDGRLLTVREAAKIIDRSHGATSYFLRWLAERGPEAPQAPAEETLTEAEPHRTWVDERSGTVFTDLGPDYGVVMLTQGEFRSLRRDYSRLWGGKAMNQSEIAYKYRFPSAHAVEVFKRIHGLRQTSIPFTDAELEEEGVDALTDKTIESLRQRFHLDLQEKERAGLKRDAEKWRALEVSIQSVLASLRPLPAPEVHLDDLLEMADAPYALMVSLTDLHLGKLAYGPDGRVIWNRAEARRVALAALRDLLAKACLRGRPTEIILMLGSDGVHVDGPQLTTTSGTPQGEQSDGTYREMVEEYLALCREILDICRAIAPTRAVIVEGNHDRTTAMLIGMMLEALYAGDERVAIVRQKGQGLILVNAGATTLAFLHGDYLKKPGALFPAIMALARELGLTLQPHVLAFGGHLHHEQVLDLGIIKYHVLTSLTPPDEWHRRALYAASTVEAQAFVIRMSGGKEAVLYSDPAILRAG